MRPSESYAFDFKGKIAEKSIFEVSLTIGANRSILASCGIHHAPDSGSKSTVTD
jgi:hypothetical protein